MNRSRLAQVVALVILLPLGGGALAGGPSNFADAKRVLEREVYVSDSERIDIYCGCPYSQRKQVDLAQCGVGGEADARDSGHIEWEHALPASWFQYSVDCYREPTRAAGGRRNNEESPREYCRRVDPKFNQMEADMQNLFPSVGSLNQARAAWAYGAVRAPDGEYGRCDFKVGDRHAQPPATVRGDVARAVLYMSDNYAIRISKQDRQLLEAWNRMDPVDAWEIERNRRIIRAGGNNNPWIDASRP